MIELLSSSKFTAGTWEQFVCCLPSITQEVITDIKQREEETNPSHFITAVAQQCIDSNPDITWKDITIALLNANEFPVANKIMDEHAGKKPLYIYKTVPTLGIIIETSKNASKTLRSVMRSHYYKLKKVMENCLEMVADEMYSKGLINREVCKVPTFEKMDVEFSALMSLYTDDVSKLAELCSSFLCCIASAEGPAKEEAIALAKDWECEVFKSHQLSFSLTKKMPEINPKEVQLSSKNRLAKELQNLYKRYALLITDIITHYATSGKHDALHVARWVQTFFDETGLAHDGVTIDEIFERMKPHYSFLDIESINDLMETYPVDDTKLQSRFDQYAEDLDSFIESAKIDDVMTATKAAIIGEGTKVDPKVILKLSGKWSEKTINNLRKLTEYLFGEEAKHLTIKKILSGSIQIQFLVSSHKIIPALIKRAEACVQFMGHFGIFQLTINDQKIIDRDENVNFCFEESLLVAITNINNIDRIKYESMVYFFFQLEIDFNYQNQQGNTGLMLASKGGHQQVVGLFLTTFSEINIQNNNGWTALMFGSSNGHHHVVELLLSKNPDINIQNNDGATALMAASYMAHHQVVDLLLSRDPDINIQNNDGVTALMFASSNGHHQVVEQLLSKDPDINIQNNDGVTALMFASSNGHHQVVEQLLSKDPDINIQNNDGWTALISACRCKHHQVVELLLNKDPDINVQNNAGVTALMFACANGYHSVVELLLSKDPDINIQNNSKATALMLASRYGHHQVIELLLDNDPDINIQNNDGWTALMFASYRGHLQVVELLLSKEPDINIQNNFGWTALMFASCYGHHHIVELLLLSRDTNINIHSEKCDLSTDNIISAFTVACYEGHSSILIFLTKKLKFLSSDERELLVAAAEGDIGTLVSMLFEVGMSPNTSLVGGITPLMIAASCGHIDIVDTLIQAGADVNKTNDEGKTALDILSDKKEEGASYIINFLITNGASTAAQANPTQSLFKEIFLPSSNISLIRSMSKTSTDTVVRSAQINKPAQKVEELSENELAQYTQQH